MKFRTKILLAIWGVVLGLIIVSYFVINYWIRVEVVSRFSRELRSNYSAVIELEGLRTSEILRDAEVVAESPRLKAVVEIGDRNTAEQLSQELSQSMKIDLFILADPQQRPLTSLEGGKPFQLPRLPYPIVSAALRHQAVSDVWTDGVNVYRCAGVPIMIGPDQVGTLMLGFRFRENDLRSVQSTTNSEVILMSDTTELGSTIQDGAARGQILSSLRVRGAGPGLSPAGAEPEIFTFTTPNNNFAATICALNRNAGDSAEARVGLVLLKPVESEVDTILSPVVRTFYGLSVIVLLLTAGIGFLISKGITRPIASLVKGTSEVSRGNYEYRIVVRGGGELRYLAEKFEEMSHALKEKISQLAERNRELEVTVQKLKEAQAELLKSERLAATGKLTAQLSHEINNPIHNIQSCLQTVLKRMEPAGEDRELLEVAYEEIGRMASLTRQMLDVYRTSLVPLERIPLGINDIIREVAIASTPALTARGVRVILDLSGQTRLILGSRDKLKQVFLNLIANARDAMPDGGLLTLASRTTNDEVGVTVTDTGVGIPEANLSKIFDAFFTTKSSVSGVGLGLSVTYGIVQQHDGRITVSSAVGKGTTIRVAFPALKE
jgi:signal transduction histidine kinase